MFLLNRDLKENWFFYFSGTDATFEQLSGNRHTRRAKSSDDWERCAPEISQNTPTDFDARVLQRCKISY